VAVSLFLVAASVLLLVHGARAHVPHYDPLWLWADLAPGGDHHITYDPCDPYLVIPPEWSQGVENWDTAMSWLMDFDQDLCQPFAEVHLRWENPEYQCPNPDVLGCWQALEWRYPPVLLEALILFDYDNYMHEDVETDGRIAISAHEWGHNMSLDEHGGDMCDSPGRIMAYVDSDNQSCMTGPSPEEVDTVIDFYGLLGPDDGDGDGFTDAVELYIGTDRYDDCPDVVGSHDAWPPDIDMDRYVSAVGDLLNFSGRIGAVPGDPEWWHRLDVNADGVITVVGDVLPCADWYGESCQ
jgi:hypothetical protein